MTELGSDLRLLAIADLARIELFARAEHERTRAEEARVVRLSPADDEPGRDYPDPDEAPPADELHEEYNPLPPPARS